MVSLPSRSLVVLLRSPIMSVAMPEDSNNRLRPVGRSPRLTGTIEGQGFRPTFTEAVENQVPWGWCRLRGDFRGTFDGDSLMPRSAVGQLESRCCGVAHARRLAGNGRIGQPVAGRAV